MTNEPANVIVGVLSAVLLFGGAWVTARSSRAATDHTTAVEGFDKLTGRLEARLAEVEARLERVEGLLRDSTRVLHVALAYIERLLDFVAEVVPDRHRTPPPIPHELTDHLPPSVVEDWRTPPPPA